jgi:hypothetical protein
LVDGVEHGGIDQPEPEGAADGHRPRRAVQAAVDAAQVILNRRLRNPQSPADLAGREAEAEQVQDLELTIGQGNRRLLRVIERQQHDERSAVLRASVEQQWCAIEYDTATHRVTSDRLAQSGSKLGMSDAEIESLREFHGPGEGGAAGQLGHDEGIIDSERNRREGGEGVGERLHGSDG